MKRILIFLAAVALAGCAPSDPDRVGERVEVVSSSEHTYRIPVGGRLDMDNTTTRTYDDITVGFQNNVSLTIANTGDVTVRNPRVVANDRGRWWTIDVLLEEALDGAATSLDSILFIHDFVQKNRYHDFPLFTDDTLHDPVAFFNEYGAGLCDDVGLVTCALLHHAGLDEMRFGENPRVRTLKGHMMVEASSESGFMFLDADENTFYLDFENERPVGGRAIARDHYLAKREVVFGPRFTGWDSGDEPAALFGVDDGYIFRAVTGRRIDFELRPGEKIEYRWDGAAPHPAGPHAKGQNRRTWGTSLWTYDVPLNGQADTQTVPMTLPYAVCGGQVMFDTDGEVPEISISLGEGHRIPLEFRKDATTGRFTASLDTLLGPPHSGPRHEFTLRVDRPDHLRGLTVEADLLVWPLSLPRLRVGDNDIAYSDETVEPHEVTVTHRWREADEPAPPKVVRKPLSPRPGAVVAAPTVPFTWPPVKGADLYHLQVSRRTDMRLPYRPSFDVYVDTTAHHSPFTGLFNPEEDYHWRVRARNADGVWGKWSGIWTFRWAGPRVPVDLEAVFNDRRVQLSWRADPRGPRPDHFEVYGSDERGFTPSKVPFEVPGLGRLPANYIGTTRESSLLVVDPGLEGDGFNRTFYRVVAVDARGTPSGPSAQLELPHPFIITTPPDSAVVGEPWAYRPVTLSNLGDLQFRYVAPIYDYWEREGYAYELTEGPAWLTWDEKSGVLSGTPGPDDAGQATVILTCHRTYPHEVGPDEHQAGHFQKEHPSFQASDVQSFDLTIQPQTP